MRWILSRPLPHWLPPWQVAGGILALAIANTWFTAWTIAELVRYPTPVDWVLAITAAHRIETGENPYAFGGRQPFLWSPMAAWLFVALSSLGATFWRLLHFGALLLLPDRRLALLGLLSWPFWFDLAAGNVMTFVFVAAFLALRGNKLASVAFLVLSVLIPRPLMIPVLVWLLWRRPLLRSWFVAIVVIHSIGLVASGWGIEWVQRLLATTPQLVGIPFDVSPGHYIGAWWTPIGLVLGLWFFTRGRLGLASLAASPYWLPYYLFMPILDLGALPATPHATAINDRSRIARSSNPR